MGDVWAEHVAISALLAGYADVVTRRAWTELDDLFVPEASIRVDTVTAPARELSGPKELGAFIADAITRFEFFELVILNSRLQLDTATDARGRVLVTEIRRDGRGEWSQTYGVYHDRYARRGERWWFADRRYQSLARSGSDAVFPFPDDFELAPPGA